MGVFVIAESRGATCVHCGHRFILEYGIPFRNPVLVNTHVGNHDHFRYHFGNIGLDFMIIVR